MKNLLITLIVLEAFRCKYNFDKRYEVDEEITDLTNFDEARIEALVAKGLVKVLKDGKESAGNGGGGNPDPTGIDISQNADVVISQVNSFEDVEKLKEALALETAARNRATVVRAIEARIEALVAKDE